MYDNPLRTAGVKVETGSRIPPLWGRFSRIPFWGISQAPTKIFYQIWCVHGTWDPPTCAMVHVRYDRLEYPRWRTAAILN